jgi:tetratricopeptide (TPR) repeat protein
MKDSSELYLKARQMMDEGKLEDAIILFEQSISHYPHFKSLELLGECFSRLNRLSEAIVPLAAATSLNKGVRAPSLLAEVFLRLKEYRQARETAEIALSREPHNRTAQRTRKIAIEMIGED